MYDIVLCVYERFRVDGLKRYVNDDRFRVDGDKNMRLLAFAFTIVFVWTGPEPRIKHADKIEPQNMGLDILIGYYVCPCWNCVVFLL